MPKTINIRKGDMLWVVLKGADQNYGYGEVINVWKDEETGLEYFDFHCLVNGGLRSGRTDNIINKPNARMVGKMAQTQKEVNEVLRNKR